MKRNILIRFWVVIGIFALAGSASGVLSVEEQVKKLAARYAQVEDQLARSVRYASRNDKGDSEQAWFNGSDDLVKLAVERRNGDERELAEYFALDFENDYDGMFMLVRKETPAPDGGVQVEESRKFFGEGKRGGNGVLIRELRKSAHFKPSEPTDTVHTPNVTVDLTQKKILGETGAGWIGTRRRYNHPECVVTWSPDSSFFVQLLANKWASDDCVAGKIASGPKFVGAVNLLKTLSPKIYAFVKKRFDPEEGGSLSFYNEKVTNDGAVEMKAEEYTSSGERKGETNFSVSVRLRLRETPKGLSIEGVNMRRLPKER